MSQDIRDGKDLRGDTAVTATGGTQRLDKWLWYARVVKTRTMAAGLVGNGKVRVNRARVDKASHTLRAGDVVTVTAHRQVRVLKVCEPGHRRGPPAEARLLYEDLTPPPVPTADTADGGIVKGAMGAHSQRPDKRQRRAILDLKRG